MESLGTDEHGSSPGTVSYWYSGAVLSKFFFFALIDGSGGWCWDLGMPINLPPH